MVAVELPRRLPPSLVVDVVASPARAVAAVLPPRRAVAVVPLRLVAVVPRRRVAVVPLRPRAVAVVALRLLAVGRKRSVWGDSSIRGGRRARL